VGCRWAGAIIAATFICLLVAAGCDSGGSEPSTRAGGGGDEVGERSCADPELSPGGRRPPAEIDAARRGRYEVFGPERVRLEPPVDWTRDPLGARRFQQNLQKLRYLDPLFDAHDRRDDVAALRRALRLGLDWVRGNPRPGPGEPDRIGWTDKVVADRAPYLAYLFRAADCEGMLSAKQRRTLRAALVEHGSYLADSDNYSEDNHGLFVDLGLFRLATLASGLPEAEAWERLARQRFLRTLRRQTAGGLWLEHSSAYQFLAIRPAERMAAAIGGDERLEAMLERMRQAAAWMVRPDGEMIQFGDSNLEPVPPWGARRAERLEGLRLYRRAGMAFARGPAAEGPEQGYLAVTAGSHGAKHKHADDLSFALHDRGVRVISDTGLYHKDVGPLRDFVLSAGAHSVLTVDGQPIPIPPARDAYGSGITGGSEADGWFAIGGRNPLLAQLGVRHRRLFLYRPGSSLIIVDRLRSEAPHLYTRYLQLGSELSARRRDGAVSLRGGGLRGAITPASGESPEITLGRGSRSPWIGWTSPDFRELVPRWRVSFRQRADSALLGLTLALDPDAPRAGRIRERAGWIEVALRDGGGDRTATLRVRRDGSALAVAGP
jgi:hypothetical protein